jgi:DNA-binding NtrC family response regulator
VTKAWNLGRFTRHTSRVTRHGKSFENDRLNHIAMNLLFIHHDPEIQSEIDDFLHSQKDDCFYSRNTEDTIRILNDHPIDLVVLIINHMRDAAVLKYINDNYKELEVLLIASEEYDEIISLFSVNQYKTVRLPLKLKDLRTSINSMISDHTEEGQRDGTND